MSSGRVHDALSFHGSASHRVVKGSPNTERASDAGPSERITKVSNCQLKSFYSVFSPRIAI